MPKPRILIIDDDKNLRKTLSDILKVKGFETLTAGNGSEGLSLAKNGFFNLAIIDLRLPDMTGIEVLNTIKSDSPSTEAIILTGNATLDSAIEATNSGAFSYLQKPYEIDQLTLQIKRALEKQKADEEIKMHDAELEKINSELKILYEISKMISRIIDLDKLFPEILEVLTAVDIFRIEKKGVFFFSEGEQLKLAYETIGLEVLPCMKGLKLGECLCGLAAKTGEVIVSVDSNADERHTIHYPGMTSHGHVVVPLQTGHKTVGVMCLYISAENGINENQVNMLTSIGNQVAVAVENAKLHKETMDLSLHDPLTGLANRRLLNVVFEKSFARAGRSGRPLSVVMIDIDFFKKYNDTHGHVAGDGLLSHVAKIIASKTREGDIAVRYGGEEFLVLLHEVGLEGACVAAESLRRTIEKELGITISLGVTSYDGLARTKEELIERADAALYQAKQKGRNRVEVYHD